MDKAIKKYPTDITELEASGIRAEWFYTPPLNTSLQDSGKMGKKLGSGTVNESNGK
jgi:hypothetical protein